MTTITIIPETPGSSATNYCAVAGALQCVGPTLGQALDTLTAQLGEAVGSTLIVVQHARLDQFFTAQQQQRLADLIARWRARHDGGVPLSAVEQDELQTLVEAEVRAAGQRAAALAQEVLP